MKSWREELHTEINTFNVIYPKSQIDKTAARFLEALVARVTAQQEKELVDEFEKDVIKGYERTSSEEMKIAKKLTAVSRNKLRSEQHIALQKIKRKRNLT